MEIKILLVNPSSMPLKEQAAFLNKTSNLRVPSFSMPLGLIDISAYLRKNADGVNIKILDIGKDLYDIYLNHKDIPEMTPEEFIQRELDKAGFCPDIVGISLLFSTAHHSSLLIASEVKHRWSNAVVVCGGNHATNFYRNLLNAPHIDYVVRGEAEISFTEFVKKLRDNDLDPDVPGVISRKKLSGGAVNETSPMIDDLDKLPMPAYDLLDTEFYRLTVGASLMFTRGCSFQCAFCASHTVHGRTIRSKSQKRILDEFDLLVDKYKFNSIVIEDDLFAVDKKKFLAVAETISSRYPSIRYQLPQGLSVSVLDEDIINAMVMMGINEAAVAIESGSEHVQRNIIKKNVSLPKARRVLEYFRTKDFFVYVNFILGFPGETRELMQETIDFIYTLDVDWVYIFRALPLPGSEIYDHLVKKKIIDPDNYDWDGLRLHRRNFDTPEITAVELEKLTYDVNIDRNFFHNSNIKHGRYQTAVDTLNRIIIDLYPFHIVGRYTRAEAFLGMGEKKLADADFRQCVEWINSNAESRRLFELYGKKMGRLGPYLKDFSKGGVVYDPVI